MLEGKGRNGYFPLGAVEVGMEPGNPQQMSVDFFGQNPIKHHKLTEYNFIGAARFVGEPGEILALFTKIQHMVVEILGNPADEVCIRAELKEVLEET